MKNLLFWCSLSLVIPLKAAFYKGTIGQTPVFMQIEFSEDGNLYGSYLNTSSILEARFDGVYKGKRLDFYAGAFTSENSQKERFVLKRKKSTLRGSWTFGDKKEKVELVEFNPESEQSPYSSNPYFASMIKNGFDTFAVVRSSLAVFKPMDSTTMLASGITLRWYKDAQWGSVLFRVESGLASGSMKSANDFLEMIQLESFGSHSGCGYSTVDMEYEFDSHLNHYYVDANFLSLEVVRSFFCGGAHPDFSSNQWNFDIKQAKQITSDDFFHFPNFAPKTEEQFELWADYRQKEFAPHVVELFKTLYPEILEGPHDGDEDCDYSQEDIWRFSEVVITQEGFKFSAYFPRVARSCDDPEWSIMPYSALKDFLTPVYAESLLGIKP